MALFRSDVQRVLVRDIAAKVAERDKIVVRLAEGEAEVKAATLAATQLAVSGADNAALDAAEAKVSALTGRVARLRRGLVDAEAAVAGLAHEQAERLDAKRRAETAAEIETMAVGLEGLVAECESLFTKMADITERASAGEIWDAIGLQNYAAASRSQIPAAIELVARALRERRDRVLNKQSPASLMKPPEPRAPSAEAPAVPPKDHFTYEASKSGPHYRVQGGFGRGTA